MRGVAIIRGQAIADVVDTLYTAKAQITRNSATNWFDVDSGARRGIHALASSCVDCSARMVEQAVNAVKLNATLVGQALADVVFAAHVLDENRLRAGRFREP